MDKKVKAIYYMNLSIMHGWALREFFSYPYKQEHQGLLWLLDQMSDWTFRKKKIFMEHLVKVLKGE